MVVLRWLTFESYADMSALGIIFVTHNMRQAARVSDITALFYLGRLIEVNETDILFTRPKIKQTQDYNTGRFG